MLLVTLSRLDMHLIYFIHTFGENKKYETTLPRMVLKIALKLYGTTCHLPFHYYVADMSLPPDFLNLSDYLKQPVARCNPPKTRLHLVLLFLFKLKEV